MDEGGWKTAARRNVGRQKPRWEDLIFVFVDNLLESTTVEQLSRVFFRFGKLADVFIHISSRIGQGKCFGFVRFWEKKEAWCAVDAMDETILGGRKLSVNIAMVGQTGAKEISSECRKGG